MPPKRRYAFQCLNPECRLNQARWIRRGVWVSCRSCGFRNPGPVRLAQAFQREILAFLQQLPCSA